MKILAAAALAALVLSACPHGSIRTYDAFQGKDMAMPKVLSYGMVENSSMRLVYDEDVFLSEIIFNGRKLDYSLSGTVFVIPFGRTLGKGEEASFSVMAEDEAGNTARSSYRLIGKNLEIPPVLINELSIKGTAESPDRIELLFPDGGNPAGMIVSDGIEGEENHAAVLPDMELAPGDLIVLYWDRKPESTEPVYSAGTSGYILWAESDTTLSGTNGAVLIYSELGGEITDGIIYTTGESDLADGYGNNRTKNAALALRRSGKWSGEPVSSALVTASRVIARLPGGIDTDSAADFFITEPRKSSFGMPNGYFPYEE